MELKNRIMYAADSADGGGIGGVTKDFDYVQVEAALTSINASIKNIQNALSKKITVTSYTGDAQAEVENAVDSIRTYLATMETPLTNITKKIDEVKSAYAASEAGIKSALSGITGSIGE